MTNVDLFDFTFVDRIEQKQKVTDTLNRKILKNIIWIYGQHGVGKSYFVNHVVKKVSKEFLVNIELKAEDQSINCMKHLLEEIDFVTKKSFVSFFQKNYKVISKLIQGVICSVVENTTKIDINSLYESVLDSGKIFIDNANQQQGSLKLITRYIDSILSTQNLLIVIDDFSLCDSRSFHLIMSLLQYYSISQKENICFILCTSHDEEYNNVEYQLQEKVILEPVELKPFDDCKYFRDILITKFNLATTTPHTLKQIFEFCKGYPERLKTFIHMVYSKGGIIFSEQSDHADFNNKIVEDVIYTNCNEYIVKEMPYIQQLILLIIVEFQKILSLEMVIDLVNYLKIKNKFIITNFLNQDIIYAILDLKKDGILTIYHNNDNYFIKLEHDLKYYNFRMQFSKDPMMPKINGLFFEYIIENKDLFLKQGFSEINIAELLAWHSYYGKVTNWIQYNLDFGYMQYQTENYESASEIFDRLSEYWHIFDNKQKLIIGNCFFHTGKYFSAKNILESVTQIEKDQAYEFYLLLTQIDNLLFNKETAIKTIDNKLLLHCENDYQKLVALNLKQRILSNVRDKRHDAKKIFDEIKENVSSDIQNTAVYGRFLMGTIEFYRGSVAEEDLKQAEKIALNTNNQYLLATLYTNKGFHEFWQGNIGLAKQNFQESQNRLTSIRMHETSYPLNNLSVCYMMEGKVEEAINCLQMGLLLNRSKYVEITLKTLLMSCYAIQKKDSCFLLMKELIDILNDTQITDISISLKIMYSVGFLYKCYGDIGQYDEYKEKAIDIALKYPPNALPFIWFKNYDTDIENYIYKNIDAEKYKFFHDFRFEPWLVTLNHD